jgi:hypothetical protein
VDGIGSLTLTLPLLTSRPEFNESIFVAKTSGLARGKHFDTKLPRRAMFGHIKTKRRKLPHLELSV